MAHATTGALTDQLAGLFDVGTCTGFSDGELLERFRARRDEGGERAFESLVTRHGPMVWGICRNVLEDPSDVHDAFQAVFLVLSRRADAIRKTESVGSWLYGVTVRVAARARATAIHRRARERRILAVASATAMAGEGPGTSRGGAVDYDDGAAVVHEEIVRLPERYREPIVLCYFEGLTHDEAAARLGWPVGTVRSRLARARDRLRGRLERRGVTAPSAIGPMAAWIVSSQETSAALRAATASLPVPVPASLARNAVRLSAGQAATAGSWPSGSLTLADGVLRAMMLKKLTVAACAIAWVGIGCGTGAFMVRRARAQAPPGPASATRSADKPPAPMIAPKSPETPPLLQELVDAARERLDAQRAFYEEGRITVDRFIEASAQSERVELLAAKSDDERRTIRHRHVDRLKEIERRERAELQVGRGTVADVAEARQARLQAEFEMGAVEKEDAEKSLLLRRIAELERKVEQLQKERGAHGRE